MSRLREQLIERYDAHYRRMNDDTALSTLSGLQRAYNDANWGSLLQGLPAGARALDLGCGAGMLLQWLEGHSALEPEGVDSSPGQIALARRALSRSQLHHADGYDFLKQHPGRYHAIFCFDVLEHIPGSDALLAWAEAMREALVPGGFALCRTPNAAHLTASFSHFNDLTHERLFTRSSLQQLFEVAGFSEYRALPLRQVRSAARWRQRIEGTLHRALFRICNRPAEPIFTSNIVVLARA